MDKTMERRPPKEGDIVQEKGHGRAMVVVNNRKYADPWWNTIPGALVCEWTVDGETDGGVYLAENLEIVGSQIRQSREEVYELLTEQSIATITNLVAAGRNEAAAGVLQLWSDVTRNYAQVSDRLRMQQLIDRAR
jgi:hypothetical protein